MTRLAAIRARMESARAVNWSEYSGACVDLASLLAVAEVACILYEETSEYIKINHLGDVHHNHTMKRMRDALAPLLAEAAR